MPRSAPQRRGALARGAEAEALVARELESRGWTVLERNWLGGNGEIDLIVRRAGCLRIVEVKQRAVDDPVGLEAIDGRKRRRLVRAARAWLAQYDEAFDEVCFLVALVEAAEITYIDNAFDA